MWSGAAGIHVPVAPLSGEPHRGRFLLKSANLPDATPTAGARSSCFLEQPFVAQDARGVRDHGEPISAVQRERRAETLASGQHAVVVLAREARYPEDVIESVLVHGCRRAVVQFRAVDF